MDSVKDHKGNSLLEIAGLFLKIGAISFGGPVAHIALMEGEFVRKRGWLDEEQFLDLLAATNLVPGPNATEMAHMIGFVHAGWLGLVIAGFSFIFPAFLISLALAWVYVQFGALPQVSSLFYGINPVVLAIVLVATYRLGKTAIQGRSQLLLCLLVLLAVFFGVNEAIILLVAGVVGILLFAPPTWSNKKIVMLIMPFIGFKIPVQQGLTRLDARLWQLTVFFFKVGALIFGSGMVLFAFIQQDVVERFGWLSQQQLIDAIAVGQMSPGPVSSSATFIGYLVSGLPGAVLATLGIFLPSFIIVALVGPFIPRLRQSRIAQAFLKGVNAAVVALILSISLVLFKAAIVDCWTLILLVLGIVALLHFKLDTFWLVLGGAMIGLLRYWAG